MQQLNNLLRTLWKLIKWTGIGLAGLLLLLVGIGLAAGEPAVPAESSAEQTVTQAPEDAVTEPEQQPPAEAETTTEGASAPQAADVQPAAAPTAAAPAPSGQAVAASTTSPPAQPSGNTVTVNRVVDGDTLEVQYDGKTEKVRLIGVDTPEVYGGAEPYGPEASAFTKSRLAGQTLRLEFDVEERDRYGRLLAYAWLGSEMFNETLVRNGYAQVMTIPPNVKYADRFVALQREAREAGRGLWAESASPAVRAGSFKPDASGNCNDLVKGNISSSGEKIYHVKGGRFYSRTDAEECFYDAVGARAAGYRASQR